MNETQMDPLYKELRQNVAQDGRMPYRQYLRERTAYYIEKIADEEELDSIVNSIKERTIPKVRPENND
jgi:hypothetical protein